MMRHPYRMVQNHLLLDQDAHFLDLEQMMENLHQIEPMLHHETGVTSHLG
uniref:Uncharacterized protein n=1 Tax=Arundo donax TaxID=35708 RepID=A0A0A9CBQ5_ARUDO